MCVGTSGKDGDRTWVWLAGLFDAPETAVLCRALNMQTSTTCLKPLSLGREHYSRTESGHCAQRQAFSQQRGSIFMHMRIKQLHFK